MAEQGPVPEVKELEAAAADVAYEIETMLFAADHLAWGHSSPAVEPEGKEMDVFLESFLLHYRNLRDFLCPRLKEQDQAPSNDTVVASDFLGMEVPQNMADASVLGKDRTRINKMLAHISYQRAKYKREGEDEWLVHTMCRDMVKGMEEFLKRLAAFAPDRRAWFPNSEVLNRSMVVLSDDAAYTSTSTSDVIVTVIELGEETGEPPANS